ncbi:tyrosine-type recombinase/integrase [Nonlabens dokdonensis]|uniref:tyrosine-type recombinase/integrase n=1 Tax=Nonlabens dokdonensis TaxID=328515 RepID=UPI001FD04657|nr:tyrosine-type recombinase/integrase [Nonlabens dokdonensis]
MLTIKRYASNTIETYIGLLIPFHKTIGVDKDLGMLSDFEILEYFKNIVLNNNYAAASQKQLSSAIRLYYKEMYNREVDFSTLATRPVQRALPVILSKQEVKLILSVLKNKKHIAMLTTIYALGLRSSELIHLKIVDIDGQRNQVFIKTAKGKKDRVVPFPEKLKFLLRDYIKEYRPKEYLFEGSGGGLYSTASLRAVFNKAKKAAGIKKYVTLHGLRHAYATHLMDAGTDVRIIKELLGHNDIKTTLIYTHVTQITLENLPSPLDLL